MLVYLGVARECNAKLRDGSLVRVAQSNWEEYWNRMTLLHMKMKLGFQAINRFTVKILFNGRKVLFKFPEIPEKFDEFSRRILELFYFEPYGLLNVKDRIVVDVGAWIGDTSALILFPFARKKHRVKLVA